MALPDEVSRTDAAVVAPVAPWMPLFVRMWAVATIMHLTGDTSSRLDSVWNILAVTAGIAVILKPRTGWLLAAMAALQIADTIAEMPYSADHWMLVAFVNLALLLTMLRRRSVGPEALVSFVPVARLLVLLGYGAAAISKWNSAFLDPVASCARAIASQASFGATEHLGISPAWGFVALAMETGIPIFLAIPATRRHAVRIAMAFHFVLSASPAFAMVDFTAALFALWILFLPERDVTALLARLDWVASRSAIVRDARRVPWLTGVIAFLVLGLSGYASTRVGTSIVLVASEVYLVAMLVAALTSWRAGGGIRRIGRPLWVQAPAVALLVLWAAQPYLGGRTTGVFTMFSGIRTEDSSNHLFMPTYALTDWHGDLVVLQSSNSPILDDPPREGMAVPLIALRRLAMDDRDLVVVGTVDGEPVTFGPGPAQVAFEPLPWWQYKWLLFRPIPVEKPGYCTMG